jgi:hypothetical protein
MFDAYRTINALRRRARHHKPPAAIEPVAHEEIAHKLGQPIEREWRYYPIIRLKSRLWRFRLTNQTAGAAGFMRI